MISFLVRKEFIDILALFRIPPRGAQRKESLRNMEQLHVKETFTVLIVDDELYNLELLGEMLMHEHYQIRKAENGENAWSLLEQTPHQYGVVILDRVMPKGDGIEVLRKMKKHSVLTRVPVIFQTAQSSKKQILEGLEAGAHYYLTKPFHKDQLLAIVRTAMDEFVYQKKLLDDAHKTSHTLALMKQGSFAFSTLEEGQDLAVMLGRAYPESDKVVVGLAELLVNAVEHGNLGISYDDKSVFTQNGEWKQEIIRRMNLPENKEKQVILEFEHTGEELRFLIKDQGDGFDWYPFLEFSPNRLFDLHGRGIAMANQQSFDHLEFHEPGNEVLAIVKLSLSS